jgi:hypothetical protein
MYNRIGNRATKTVSLPKSSAVLAKAERPKHESTVLHELQNHVAEFNRKKRDDQHKHQVKHVMQVFARPQIP